MQRNRFLPSLEPKPKMQHKRPEKKIIWLIFKSFFQIPLFLFSSPFPFLLFSFPIALPYIIVRIRENDIRRIFDKIMTFHVFTFRKSNHLKNSDRFFTSKIKFDANFSKWKLFETFLLKLRPFNFKKFNQKSKFWILELKLIWTWVERFENWFEPEVAAVLVCLLSLHSNRFGPTAPA